jgi:DNA-binding transcriptional MerR regulator
VEQDGYTIKQAAEAVGCSTAFIRKQKRAGRVQPAERQGRYGNELRFTAADIDTLHALYNRPTQRQRAAATTTAIIGADVLREQLQHLQSVHDELLSRAARAEADADAMSARVLGLQQELTAERERLAADRAAADAVLAAERQRIEALKALGVWDRLLGHHKRI